MNLPNACTISRIPLMFLIVGLLYVERAGTPTATFLLFVIAGLTDFLDGYLARRMKIVSNFGILMDAVTDKVLLLGIMIALIDLNRVPLDLGALRLPTFVPVFMLLLMLGREFLITGLRLVAASKGVVVAADKGGKQKTVTQILAVGAFLLADVVAMDLAAWLPWDLHVMVAVFQYGGLVLFTLATWFTIRSGWSYFQRYGGMVLSGL